MVKFSLLWGRLRLLDGSGMLLRQLDEIQENHLEHSTFIFFASVHIYNAVIQNWSSFQLKNSYCTNYKRIFFFGNCSWCIFDKLIPIEFIILKKKESNSERQWIQFALFNGETLKRCSLCRQTWFNWEGRSSFLQAGNQRSSLSC